MRPIINAVVDKGSFFEMGANFGRPIIVASRGWKAAPVLLLAAIPFTMADRDGGSLPEVVRWVDFANFHLPIVYLMDCPGFMIGLRPKGRHHPHGVRAMAAVTRPRALVHRHRAQFLRRRRRGPSTGRPLLAALCLAVGLLGFAAAGRRH